VSSRGLHGGVHERTRSDPADGNVMSAEVPRSAHGIQCHLCKEEIMIHVIRHHSPRKPGSREILGNSGQRPHGARRESGIEYASEPFDPRTP